VPFQALHITTKRHKQPLLYILHLRRAVHICIIILACGTTRDIETSQATNTVISHHLRSVHASLHRDDYPRQVRFLYDLAALLPKQFLNKDTSER